MTRLTIDQILIRQLVRNGTLSADDIDQMMQDLREQGDDDIAYQVGACFAEAHQPSQAEWRREKLEVVDGGKKAKPDL